MLAGPLAAAHRKEGQLLGTMQRLGFDLGQKAELEAITEEALRSSEIEGETLNRESVRSSVGRRIGLPEARLTTEDRKTEGIVAVTLDATKNYQEALTETRLAGWHAALFPTGYACMQRIRVGQWRGDAKGLMQVVSGPIIKPKIHFEAFPASKVPGEMAAFLEWFEKPRQIDAMLQAAIAHLWFVTIYPSDNETDAWRTCVSRAGKIRRNASIVFPKQFAWNVRNTMQPWNGRRKATWKSPTGCYGSSAAFPRPSTRRRIPRTAS